MISPNQRVLPCTDVEIRVLAELVKDGAENKLIGRRLGLSCDTVKTHLKRINRMAEAPNRTSLAVDLVRGNLVVVNTRGRVHEF